MKNVCHNFFIDTLSSKITFKTMINIIKTLSTPVLPTFNLVTNIFFFFYVPDVGFPTTIMKQIFHATQNVVMNQFHFHF